ncbi:aminodeoxychorismate synthase [Bombardia bombarda]|uniref:aminodeoxychorismate synthase n=1 Tax=Bombardia bombarda TaxID=252184 RepID=A0AA39XJR7_9PEZI|nr:aminodeoxychorismate synthase [Bombardia bombarda]
MSRPRILFLDAYDSFSNNITSLLTTLLDVDVFVLPIDSPLLDPTSADFEQRLREELSRYVAVVCGPGPGHPDNDADVGLMKHIWRLHDAEDLLPVLGICLGFQSLVASCGGKVRRLQRGLHGMVREILHRPAADYNEETTAGDIFAHVGNFKATLYHSLCGDIGQQAVSEAEWDKARWRALPACPDLLPLAWVEEHRGERDGVERILMAVKHRTRPFWGLQYHPESVCTEKEGNRVIVNWFREAMWWNASRQRVSVPGGDILARDATKPSLLSQLSAAPAEQWWESLHVDAVYQSMTISLPHGVQIPDIVEALGPEESESIILDSANAAASAAARADVRGRYSVIATGLEEALRIEHHTCDDYATVKVGRVGGLLQRISLAPYSGIWGLSDIGVPLQHPRGHHRPDLCFVWVTKSLVVDHTMGVVHIQQLCPRGLEENPWVEKTATRLLSSRIFQGRFPPDGLSPRKETQHVATYQQQPLRTRRLSKSTSIQTPLTRDYESKVELCQEFIAAGESYELCLTDQTKISRPVSDSSAEKSSADGLPMQKRCGSSLSAPPSSWQLFKMLRSRQPAPFASYIRLGEATLVSASPERFLQYDQDGYCSMRPMKGTVRKSEQVSTLAEAERILHIPKEEAENLMIVDLVRHDLHGICGAGNVSVPHLLKVEEYQSVFQMITVVEGQLPKPADGDSESGNAQRYTGLDVLAASLPPGSMTGAPKKRSCEILQQIEQHHERSLYSGVVGYMCATGRGDWSVTIRSLFRWDDEQVPSGGEDGGEGPHEVWRIGAGGAVTILSTPEGEREEMFTKLAGPLRVFADSG